jgi:hypothetical protein
VTKKLFPKNFLTIQIPPTLRVKERRDGALIIYPPTQGDGRSTMRIMDTEAGTSTASNTNTNAGTSTEGQTWTRTRTATVLESEKEGFPVIAAGFASVYPTRDGSEPDLSQDSFQLAEPIPQGDPTSGANIHLTGEPKLTDFTVKNVVFPPADEAKPSFTLPDVSPPWDGGIATASDSDDDNPGDSDHDPDDDDDDDDDDGSDQGSNRDTTDLPGGFSGLKKHVQITPPFAPKGTKGKVRRR